MSDPHVIADAADVKAFVLAGNAIFTLVSLKTGARFTYRVRTAPDDTSSVSHFVSVLTDPDNVHGYKYMGQIYRRSGDFVHGVKSSIGQDAPSAKAFAWLYQKVMCDGKDPSSLSLEVWHDGRCGACGLLLTVPESIARGLGPKCASKGA